MIRLLICCWRKELWWRPRRRTAWHRYTWPHRATMLRVLVSLTSTMLQSTKWPWCGEALFSLASFILVVSVVITLPSHAKTLKPCLVPICCHVCSQFFSLIIYKQCLFVRKIYKFLQSSNHRIKLWLMFKISTSLTVNMPILDVFRHNWLCCYTVAVACILALLSLFSVEINSVHLCMHCVRTIWRLCMLLLIVAMWRWLNCCWISSVKLMPGHWYVDLFFGCNISLPLTTWLPVSDESLVLLGVFFSVFSFIGLAHIAERHYHTFYCILHSIVFWYIF